MVKENILRLYKHFSMLASGDFTESTFYKDYGKGGRMSLGDITPERRDLIISDAKRHLADLERKFPHLVKAIEKPSEE